MSVPMRNWPLECRWKLSPRQIDVGARPGGRCQHAPGHFIRPEVTLVLLPPTNGVQRLYEELPEGNGMVICPGNCPWSGRARSETFSFASRSASCS
jgi:hypothetical protein